MVIERFMKLQKNVLKAEQSSSYPVGVEWKSDVNWSNDVSFVTDLLPEDTLIGSYMKLVIWVFSTSPDRELHPQLESLTKITGRSLTLVR